MLRKKACAVTLSLALSCQLLIVPMANAGSVDEAVNNIVKDPSYTKVVNQLGVDSNVVEGFVRDVVNKIDKSQINNDSYVKGFVSKELIKNDALSDAVLSLSPDDYANAKDAVKALGNTLRSELANTATPGTPGGASGGGTSEKFDLNTSGSRAIVESDGKAYIYLTGTQLKKVKDAGKSLEMQFSDVKLSFSPAALNVGTILDKEDSEFKVRVKTLSDSEIKSLMDAAKNGGVYQPAGDIYDLTAETVEDSSRVNSISTFNGTITVSLPVAADYRNSATAGKLKAYIYNETSKKWDLVGGTFASSSNVMNFETKHFSKYALLEEASKTETKPEVQPENTTTKIFSDIAGHWAAADIQFMADKGYVSGVEADKFQPQALVTRAEFVTMLVNVLDLQGEAEANFKDVNKQAWYYSSVALACKAGLAKGNSQDSFAPGAPITRQEMAAMLVNAMKYKGIAVQADQGVLTNFVDRSQVADWAKSSAAAAFNAKIISGKPAQNGVAFGPRDNTTRAEAVVMLKNFLQNNK